jgi:hypothetical protein
MLIVNTWKLILYHEAFLLLLKELKYILYGKRGHFWLSLNKASHAILQRPRLILA